MLLSLMVVALLVAAGTGVTYGVSDMLRFEERLAIGAVLGPLTFYVAALAMFPVIGLGAAALLLSTAVLVALAILGVRGRTDRLRHELSFTARRLRLPSARPSSLRPLAAVTAASTAVATRTLAIAYQSTPEGLSVGSLAVWSDWSAHLAYASSFAFGDNRSFDLPTASGHGFRYHFLADFAGAVFTVSGSTIQQSMVLSEWILAVAFAPLMWCAVMRLTRSRLVAGLTLGLLALSGGIGLWYFAADVEEGGWSIITSLPRTYARIPDVHLWVDNTISASFYAQRSTMLGTVVGLSALILVLASRPGWRRRGFLVAGLMVGVLGIGHAHLMMTALVLACLALVADRDKTWLWFVVPVVIVGAPLAYSILPEESSIRWLAGWMAPASGQPWPWFWLRNVGLLLPIFLFISLFGGVQPRLRRLTMPLWLWFLVPNVIAFHPSEWNNTKYFFFWQAAGCLVVASWLARPFTIAGTTLASNGWRRTTLQVGAVTAALFMMSAGALDTLRAMQRSTAIPWVTHDDLAAAMWLRSTAPDAVIVYGTSNTSAAAALGGRRAVSGYPGWTYDLGLSDWSERWTASAQVLSGEGDVDSLVSTYSIDYVVIGPRERREMNASDDFWERNGELQFRSGDVSVYSVG